jgi:dTDP-4-amino-4,6-dideoxygalactose transaminase
MSDWTVQRKRNAAQIWDTCRKHAAVAVPEAPVGHAQYKCYVYVRPENLAAGWSRDRIIDEIVAQGVPCYQGSCSEVYLEAAFDGSGWRPAERMPVARQLGETALMFLVHPTLTTAEIQKTCAAIDDVLERACR